MEISKVLEADSIAKTYNERVVLSDVYLKCETGDIIGLFGRNGTGKSTLMKILFGIEDADNKFIRINGKKLSGQSESFRVVSYLSQDSFLPGDLKVRDVIRLALNSTNLSSFEIDPIVSKILNTRVYSLSGGELRYLEIKLVLNLSSDFVLLDEPFNGLSPILIELVIEVIKEAAVSKGIIITDHDYRHVLQVINKSYLLHDGALKKIDGREDLVRWGYLKPEE